MRRHRRSSTQLQSGQGVNFIGKRRDTQVAEQIDCNLGSSFDVDPRSTPPWRTLPGYSWEVRFRSSRQSVGPKQSSFIRYAITQLDGLLHHGNGNMRLVFNLRQSLIRVALDRYGILGHRRRFGRRTIIHPHQIAAGPLRHGAHKWTIAIPGLMQTLRDELAEQTVIIRRDWTRAKVMLRVVGQNAQGCPIELLQGNDGKRRIDRPRRRPITSGLR